MSKHQVSEIQVSEIRVEVHGAGTQELPAVRAILHVCDHPAVKVCWNSNPQDLRGGGLEHDFWLVRQWFGGTVQVRERELFEEFRTTAIHQVALERTPGGPRAHTGWPSSAHQVALERNG